MIRLTTHGDPVREPKPLQPAMKLWRAGLTEMPKDYLDYHEAAAREELEALRQKFRLTVHRTWMESDGWCDGMKSVNAVVETPAGKLWKIRWQDGSMGFFKWTCGWVPLREEDFR